MAAAGSGAGAAGSVEFGPYFSQHPVRQYVGHTEDILDISWSAGGFLLSASLDKSVRLWHLSQPGCLRQFWHTDFVTSVQFHPLDAQRFVSGSIDGKIRVWSIAEQQQGAVLATVQLHQDMVTAVGFSLNGGRVLAGTMRGRVRFYELADRKLEYVAQVDVRNQRGQHASGKKVTGIHAVPGQPQQFLITTNDSRLRLLEGYGIMLKFKGHRNSSTQMRAGLSPDGSQVVCGSDDGWVYVWQLGAKAPAAGSSRLAVAAQEFQDLAGKNAVYQSFQAHDAGVPVTAVVFAPPGVCDGRPSVLLSHAGSGVVAGGGAGTAADGEGVPVRPGFAGRTVQSILVSGGFSGAIKVHELL
ncbi:WD40-repeat-containing domain protein [Scenedesmus sp. NREL 46B-D3]|nr:WD40-repeat-containing domain protein [Scenedesmus sp. NREL 46B-D3]